jgi:hypothetical protein
MDDRRAPISRSARALTKLLLKVPANLAARRCCDVATSSPVSPSFRLTPYALSSVGVPVHNRETFCHQASWFHLSLNRCRGSALWLLILAVMVSGCDEAPPTPPIRGCAICDPTAHDIFPNGCQTSADCPTGTKCVTSDAGAGESDGEARMLGGCDAGRPDYTNRCKLPNGTDHASLTRGFRVNEISLRSDGDAGSSTTFSWTAPEGTRIVSCALFACQPEVRDMAIVNYDQCVLFRSAFRNQTQGTFDLVDPVTLDPEEQMPSMCSVAPEFTTDRNGHHNGLVVTDLLVGCWSYGDTNITGASRLLAITPAQSPNYRDSVFRGCESEADEDTDGRSCYLEKDRQFGSCWSHTCLPRCQSDDDCARTEVPLGVASPDASASADAVNSGALPVEAGAAAPVAPCHCAFPFDNLPYIGVCPLRAEDGGACP